MSTVPGLDVSYWQARVDWARVRATGARFVFIKATEGAGYTDSTFVDHWEGAGAHGMLRGAYCFFHPNQDAKRQAEQFVRIVRERSSDPELPCSIDLEVTDGVPNSRIISGAKLWLEEVAQRLGRRPMIYSGVAFLETNFSEQGRPPEWTRDYALWIGWFPYRYLPGLNPLMPKGWSSWRFWQYSGKGRIAGIDVAVDLDFFNGTEDDLVAFASGSIPATVAVTHVIAPGETAESIAGKYLITVSELLAANPQLLQVGGKLTIPGQIATAPAQARLHTVQAGETLYSIAQKYQTNIAALVSRNKLRNPDILQVGQILEVA